MLSIYYNLQAYFPKVDKVSHYLTISLVYHSLSYYVD